MTMVCDTYTYSQWIYPLKIAIFHSYVSLPEGKSLLIHY